MVLKSSAKSTALSCALCLRRNRDSSSDTKESTSIWLMVHRQWEVQSSNPTHPLNTPLSLMAHWSMDLTPLCFNRFWMSPGSWPISSQ